MIPYWVIFLFPAVLAVTEAHSAPRRIVGGPLWFLFIAVVALMVGWRYQVGGDWGNYMRVFDQIVNLYEFSASGFAELLSESKMEPAYTLLNVLCSEVGWGMLGVNFFCGVIFCFGLSRFCLSLPRPWLALAVATPYLIIVVAMGYSRQGVALGCEMLALVEIGKGRGLTRFIIWTIIGATFHKTALLLLPIAALASERNRIRSLLWGAATAGAGYLLLVQNDADQLFQNYVEAQYQSAGAAIRIAMNVVPATLVLIFRKRMQFPETQQRIWYWFSVISILLAGLLAVSPSSTAVDRIALYMLPLQLAAFAALPNIMPGRNTAPLLVVSSLVYYAASLFVWLNYAVNSRLWLPYRFYLFVT